MYEHLGRRKPIHSYKSKHRKSSRLNKKTMQEKLKPIYHHYSVIASDNQTKYMRDDSEQNYNNNKSDEGPNNAQSTGDTTSTGRSNFFHAFVRAFSSEMIGTSITPTQSATNFVGLSKVNASGHESDPTKQTTRLLSKVNDKLVQPVHQEISKDIIVPTKDVMNTMEVKNVSQALPNSNKLKDNHQIPEKVDKQSMEMPMLAQEKREPVKYLNSSFFSNFKKSKEKKEKPKYPYLSRKAPASSSADSQPGENTSEQISNTIIGDDKFEFHSVIDVPKAEIPIDKEKVEKGPLERSTATFSEIFSKYARALSPSKKETSPTKITDPIMNMGSSDIKNSIEIPITEYLPKRSNTLNGLSSINKGKSQSTIKKPATERIPARAKSAFPIEKRSAKKSPVNLRWLKKERESSPVRAHSPNSADKSIPITKPDVDYIQKEETTKLDAIDISNKDNSLKTDNDVQNVEVPKDSDQKPKIQQTEDVNKVEKGMLEKNIAPFSDILSSFAKAISPRRAESSPTKIKDAVVDMKSINTENQTEVPMKETSPKRLDISDGLTSINKKKSKFTMKSPTREETQGTSKSVFSVRSPVNSKLLKKDEASSPTQKSKTTIQHTSDDNQEEKKTKLDMAHANDKDQTFKTVDGVENVGIPKYDHVKKDEIKKSDSIQKVEKGMLERTMAPISELFSNFARALSPNREASSPVKVKKPGLDNKPRKIDNASKIEVPTAEMKSAKLENPQNVTSMNEVPNLSSVTSPIKKESPVIKPGKYGKPSPTVTSPIKKASPVIKPVNSPSNYGKPSPMAKQGTNDSHEERQRSPCQIGIMEESKTIKRADHLNSSFFTDYKQPKPKPHSSRNRFYTANTKNLTQSTSFKNYLVSLGTRLNKPSSKGPVKQAQANNGSFQTLLKSSDLTNYRSSYIKPYVAKESENKLEQVNIGNNDCGTLFKNTIEQDKECTIIDDLRMTYGSEPMDLKTDRCGPSEDSRNPMEHEKAADLQNQEMPTTIFDIQDSGLERERDTNDLKENISDSYKYNSSLEGIQEKYQPKFSDITSNREKPDEIESKHEQLIDVDIESIRSETDVKLLEDVLETVKQELSADLQGNLEHLSALDTAVDELKKELSQDIGVIFTPEQMSAIRCLAESTYEPKTNASRKEGMNYDDARLSETNTHTKDVNPQIFDEPDVFSKYNNIMNEDTDNSSHILGPTVLLDNCDKKNLNLLSTVKKHQFNTDGMTTGEDATCHSMKYRGLPLGKKSHTKRLLLGKKSQPIQSQRHILGKRVRPHKLFNPDGYLGLFSTRTKKSDNKIIGPDDSPKVYISEHNAPSHHEPTSAPHIQISRDDAYDRGRLVLEGLGKGLNGEDVGGSSFHESQQGLTVHQSRTQITNHTPRMAGKNSFMLAKQTKCVDKKKGQITKRHRKTPVNCAFLTMIQRKTSEDGTSLRKNAECLSTRWTKSLKGSTYLINDEDCNDAPEPRALMCLPCSVDDTSAIDTQTQPLNAQSCLINDASYMEANETKGVLCQPCSLNLNEPTLNPDTHFTNSSEREDIFRPTILEEIIGNVGTNSMQCSSLSENDIQNLSATPIVTSLEGNHFSPLTTLLSKKTTEDSVLNRTTHVTPNHESEPQERDSATRIDNENAKQKSTASQEFSFFEDPFSFVEHSNDTACDLKETYDVKKVNNVIHLTGSSIKDRKLQKKGGSFLESIKKDLGAIIHVRNEGEKPMKTNAPKTLRKTSNQRGREIYNAKKTASDTLQKAEASKSQILLYGKEKKSKYGHDNLLCQDASLSRTMNYNKPVTDGNTTRLRSAERKQTKNNKVDPPAPRLRNAYSGFRVKSNSYSKNVTNTSEPVTITQEGGGAGNSQLKRRGTSHDANRRSPDRATFKRIDRSVSPIKYRKNNPINRQHRSRIDSFNEYQDLKEYKTLQRQLAADKKESLMKKVQEVSKQMNQRSDQHHVTKPCEEFACELDQQLEAEKSPDHPKKSNDKVMRYRVSSVASRQVPVVSAQEQSAQAELTEEQSIKNTIIDYLVGWKKKNDECFRYRRGGAQLNTDQEGCEELLPCHTEPTVIRTASDMSITGEDGHIIPTLLRDDHDGPPSHVSVSVTSDPYDPSEHFDNDIKRAFAGSSSSYNVEEIMPYRSQDTELEPCMESEVDPVRSDQQAIGHCSMPVEDTSHAAAQSHSDLSETLLPCFLDPTVETSMDEQQPCNVIASVSNLPRESMSSLLSAEKRPSFIEPCWESEGRDRRLVLSLDDDLRSSSVDGPPGKDVPVCVKEVSSHSLSGMTKRPSALEILRSDSTTMAEKIEQVISPTPSNRTDTAPNQEGSLDVICKDNCDNTSMARADFSPSSVASFGQAEPMTETPVHQFLSNTFTIERDHSLTLIPNDDFSIAHDRSSSVDPEAIVGTKNAKRSLSPRSRSGEKIMQSVLEEDVQIQSTSRVAPTKSYSLPNNKSGLFSEVELSDITENDDYSVATDDTQCEGPDFARSIASDAHIDPWCETITKNMVLSQAAHLNEKPSLDHLYREFLQKQCSDVDGVRNEINKKITTDQEITGKQAEKDTPETNPISKWWRSYYSSRRPTTPDPIEQVSYQEKSGSSPVSSRKSAVASRKNVKRPKRCLTVTQKPSQPLIKSRQSKTNKTVGGNTKPIGNLSRKTSAKNISMNSANSEHQKLDESRITACNKQSSAKSVCRKTLKREGTLTSLEKDVKMAFDLENRIMKNVEMETFNSAESFNLCRFCF